MKLESDSQLELFSDVRQGRAAFEPRGAFFRAIQGYERKIILIIAFMITAITAFSLGVEKGKNYLAKQADSSKAQSLPAIMPQPQQYIPVVKQEPVIPKAQPVNIAASLGSYTIQVASYKNEKYAKLEAEALKKKGILPIVMPKGNYYILCAGNFQSREQANSLLSQINQQKRYDGAFIRRL